MLLLRFAAVLTLVVWVGGLLALGGVVAPAIFDVAAAQHVSDGRLLSGAIFGEILRRFNLITYGAGIVLLLTLVVRAILGPRPRRFAWRAALVLVMLATSVYSGVFLAHASVNCSRRSASRRRASRSTIPGASSSAGCTGCRPRCNWCRSSEGWR